MGQCVSKRNISSNQTVNASFTESTSPTKRSKSSKIRRSTSTINQAKREERRLLCELFDKFDVDKDNRLNLEEIDCFLRYIYERRGRSQTIVNEKLIVKFVQSVSEKHSESITR